MTKRHTSIACLVGALLVAVVALAMNLDDAQLAFAGMAFTALLGIAFPRPGAPVPDAIDKAWAIRDLSEWTDVTNNPDSEGGTE